MRKAIVIKKAALLGFMKKSFKMMQKGRIYNAKNEDLLDNNKH
jgi:hypothetical protein